jgi:hypothetical protein
MGVGGGCICLSHKAKLGELQVESLEIYKQKDRPTGRSKVNITMDIKEAVCRKWAGFNSHNSIVL